jgi:tryptophanyl-tRNA synthetase
MAPSRIFSGIQPTGDLHLGNYFGAVRNWVELQQRDAQTIYCVVDYHAITGQVAREELSRRTLQLAGDLLACGIDPDRSILFVQSHVPAHTELAWVFSAFAAYGDLTRMTQFKDKSSRTRHVSAGLFTYPVLQAADILLYLADGVPVGEDQSQHLELTRGIARRFNNVVGEEFFPEVETLLTEGKRIMSLVEPERKMSKSLGEKHYVGIMEPPKRAAKKIRSAVTDAGGEARDELSPGVANLIGLLRLAGDTEAASGYEAEALSGELLYGHLKVAVADRITELLEPIQERRAALTDEVVLEVLSAGAEKATGIAGPVMERVRELVGVGASALRD